MKYTSEIIIDLPIEKVVSVFNNQDYMFEWMEGLKKVTPLTRIQGEIGSRMEMYFEIGKRKMHIIETILDKKLPQHMICKYNSFGMESTVSIHFEAIETVKTKYSTISNYKFKGLFKLMSIFSSKVFKNQSYKYLADFKEFVENKA